MINERHKPSPTYFTACQKKANGFALTDDEMRAIEAERAYTGEIERQIWREQERTMQVAKRVGHD